MQTIPENSLHTNIEAVESDHVVVVVVAGVNYCYISVAALPTRQRCSTFQRSDPSIHRAPVHQPLEASC